MDPKQLREATRPEHEATEAKMPLGGSAFSRELYSEVLLTMLPIVEGWERFAEERAPEDLQPLLPARRRSHLLRQDLLTMGRGADLPPADGVPWAEVVGGDVGSPEFHASFLGALYVMEGSTLGGRFLARHVAGVLHLQPGEGTAYFEGHGQATGALWREVMEKLSEVPPEAASTVIAAARRSFQAFGDAMSRGFVDEGKTHG